MIRGSSLKRAVTAMAIPAAALLLGTHMNTSACSGGGGKEASFSPKEFRSFPITSIRQLTPDTKQFVCALPNKQAEMGMGVSSCVMIKSDKPDKDGKVVARPYTPTSTNDHRGEFELVVKVYPTGNVSKYLGGLKVGDSIAVKGPFAKLQYKANMKKKIGLIAGGSGITPVMQLLHEILNNPWDNTEVHLLFANKTPEDIIFKPLLDFLMASHKNFKVTYFVAKNPNDVPLDKATTREGFVTASAIRSLLPPPSSEHLIYVCGPPPMMEAISGGKKSPSDQGPIKGALMELGYSPDMVYKF